METNEIRASLVGAHFRPPAKQVLSALAAGTSLWLVPEPENPYDPKAIAVYWDARSADPETQARIIDAIEGTGAEFDELDQLQLGYVADSDGKACKQWGTPGNREIALAVAMLGGGEAQWPAEASLAFDAKGFPQIVVA